MTFTRIDLTDNLSRFPIAYGWQPVRGWAVKHFDTTFGQGTQRTKQNALGEGPWDGCEGLWCDGFSIPPEDFTFHPGDANDVPDGNFPADSLHPWSAYVSAKCPFGLDENQTENLFGVYRALRTGNYDGAGNQLNVGGAIVNPADPRTEFFFQPNPANAAVDQILRWGKRPNSIINWPAWVNWRDFNNELIPIDDSTYTPRALSLTPTTGGGLPPGPYFTRVSTMVGGQESSASLYTLETKANKIVLSAGANAFQVNWLIKEDDKVEPVTPPGITGYRVYFGVADGVWLGYFDVPNPAARNFIITTSMGTTPGNPIDIATPGLLVGVKRFECGLFFIPPYDMVTSLDRICQISCADWQWSGLGTNTYRNDKVRFMSPADRAPVFTFNLAETGMGSLKTQPVDRRSRPNQVIVNFRDRDDPYLGEAPPVILNREKLQSDDGQIKAQTIEGGTMHRNQAQRVASFFARVLCDMDQMATLTASPKSYFVLPGDVFNVTNPMPDWTDVQFIVRKKMETVESALGDNLLAQLYTNGLYSDTDYAPLPLALPTPRFDPFLPPPIASNLVLVEVGGLSPDISYVSGMQGTFDFGPYGGQTIARVYLKGPSPTEPPDDQYVFQELVEPDADNKGIFHLRPLAWGNYWVQVVTENELGISAPTGHPVASISLSPPAYTLMKAFDNVVPRSAYEDTLGLTVGFAPSGPGKWFGVNLYRDRGYGPEKIGVFPANEATMGHTTDNGISWLGNDSGYNTLWIWKESGPNFTNASDADITAGMNNFFVGREKIGIKVFTPMGGGLWKGEGLVRGLNHTEIFKDSHIGPEDIILLDSAITFLPIDRRDAGTTLHFWPVTFHQNITSVAVVNVPIRGDSLRPYAVSNYSAIRDTSNDWLIHFDGNPTAQQMPAEWEVEIYSDNTYTTLKRRLPVVIGTGNACTLVGTADGEYGVLKNNLYVPTTGPEQACTVQALNRTWSRYDFNIRWIGPDHTLFMPITFHQFITAAFLGALNRNPTPAEEADWTGTLTTEYAKGHAALLTECQRRMTLLMTGAEYIGLGTTDDTFVNDCYQAFLMRNSEPAGHDFWLDQTISGGRPHVINGFNVSIEFDTEIVKVLEPGTDPSRRVMVCLETKNDTIPGPPVLANCPIILSWEAAVMPGAVAERVLNFSTPIFEEAAFSDLRNQVDPGYSLNRDARAVSGRIGPRYTFFLLGTEYRIYVDYVPNAGQKPLAKCSAPSAGFPFPLRLTVDVKDTLSGLLCVENVTIAGDVMPATIYAHDQQILDFAAVQGTLYIKIYQKARVPGFDGFPIYFTAIG